MPKHLIELLVGGTRKSFWTKGRAVAAVSIMSQLVTLLVTKRPSLAPLQTVLTTLLTPTDDPDSTETANDMPALLKRIKELRGRMVSANAAEQARLQAQVEVLVDLVTEQP